MCPGWKYIAVDGIPEVDESPSPNCTEEDSSCDAQCPFEATECRRIYTPSQDRNEYCVNYNKVESSQPEHIRRDLYARRKHFSSVFPHFIKWVIGEAA